VVSVSSARFFVLKFMGLNGGAYLIAKAKKKKRKKQQLQPVVLNFQEVIFAQFI
jgi:positive regulator of sigma E activity